jgi:hypothetical protein
MIAIKGYMNGGRFEPEDDVIVPDGSEVIVTILNDGELVRYSPEQQWEAWKKFSEGIRNAPPLSKEFDEAVGL